MVPPATLAQVALKVSWLASLMPSLVLPATLSRQSDFPKAQLWWSCSLALFLSMAFHDQCKLHYCHKRHFIIFWPLLPLFQPHPSPLSSLHAICGTHTGLREIWHFPDSLYPPVLCTFLFVWNKLLTTFQCHLVDCDSSFRIQYKYNHIISPRKPFQSLSILAISLSYMLPCLPVCISIITFKPQY